MQAAHTWAGEIGVALGTGDSAGRKGSEGGEDGLDRGRCYDEHYGVEADVVVLAEIILGDLIIAIEGKKIVTYDDLYSALDERPIGSVVKVTARRAERERTVPVTLVDMQDVR